MVYQKKLNPCQWSPLTLYELSAAAVEALLSPPALQWGVDHVAQWCDGLGLARYTDCFIDNQIDGRRLLLLEDPSHLPLINIHDFEHIKVITSSIRHLYGTELVQFSRSVGLPPRRPLTHCTAFRARTGPPLGIRRTWTRADILRWMKILMPAPIHRDHWDLVWYLRPDFPSVKFGRVKVPTYEMFVPGFKQPTMEEPEPCKEYLVPRRFKITTSIPPEKQMIWIQRREEQREEIQEEDKEKDKKVKKERYYIDPASNLLPKRVSLEGKKGARLILAKRKMPKHKFLSQ